MTAPARQPTPARIQSIDALRGAVMVLMAIDHVRVYSGVPAGGPSADIFFTRWVTHFCAPAFAFFAGTSAFLYGRKLSGPRPLARYLALRGIVLVVLELTLIRFTWTFNFDYGGFTLAGVIWMLGWCMVLLAPMVWLPAPAVGALGVAIVAFQHVFAQPALGALWDFVYPTGVRHAHSIAILYVLVPWIGVMAAGYGFGAILRRADRDRICLAIGLGSTIIFLIAGSLTVHSDPRPFLIRLLDQQKYPASLLFLLMTLGPTIALMPLADRARAGVLSAFGRAPLFYYLLHIPAIHLAALVVNYLREGAFHQDWYATAPFTTVPRDHRWPLPLLYVVWAIVVTALYFACRRWRKL